MDIAFQLYSARNNPLPEVLKLISSLGYTQAEGYGALYTDPKALRAQLDENGLSMPTAHINIADLEKTDEALRLAETLGIKVLICPWLAPDARPQEAAGWEQLGARLEKIAKAVNAAGLQFGYHNHDFEFAQIGGRYAMEIMLDASPSTLIEADVAWIYRGKGDAPKWLEANGKKIIAVHVKDIAPAGENLDEDGWADVGHGTLPWADLFRLARSKTSAKYFVAEHDKPSDVDRFASRSIAAIKSFGA